MSLTYKKFLQLFSKAKANKLLSQSEHALERESLRVSADGKISQTPHPESLGSPMTNPYIATDFAEPQLELITPIFKTEKGAINFLDDVHSFVYQNLQNNELLWPASMPCRLPKKDSEIPLAQFGDSNEAKKRTIYRNGLGIRYGRKMQTVSGVHYNFSFSQNFWKELHQAEKSKLELQDFIDTKYFHMMRNFLRYGWLNSYLFGASPAIDKTYIAKRPRELNKCGRSTCYAKNATSLRISDFGYNSKIQQQLIISFNNLDQYIKDLDYAVTTPNSTYAKLKGEQLNDHWLQIENEYYSPVRPKQPPQEGETVRGALKNRGIKYLEIRSIDVDLNSPSGVSEDQLIFVHSLLAYCLSKPSPEFSKEDKKQALSNWNKVGFHGRNTDIELQIGKEEKTLFQWADKIMHEMAEVAALLDKAHSNKKYSRNLKFEKEKIFDPELLPSAQIINEISENKKCFTTICLEKANKHKSYLKKHKPPAARQKLIAQTVTDSLYEKEGIEIHDQFVYEKYKDMELSTQMLIREAENMNINVEVIDRQDNFIFLSKGRKSKYVKQATFTDRESIISYFIMNNKLVMKHLLQSHKINVPSGGAFSSIKEAITNYDKFSDKRIVVKPQNTNFGIGINFVDKNSPTDFKAALKDAFEYDHSVIVEEFVKGMEFRFLVVEGKVLSVLHRVPANVVGDGKSTIKELVDRKNNDPRNYKIKKYHIKLGKAELAQLKKQKLKTSSKPKKDQVVYLRENSNVSTGGDPVDYTDKIPDSYKKIAQKAAKAADSVFCGVDMIIQNHNTEADKNNHSIIEINYNPTIFIHEFTINGRGPNIARPILKAIGF